MPGSGYAREGATAQGAQGGQSAQEALEPLSGRNPQQEYLQDVERQRPPAVVDQGLANYQAALGSYLGGELHKAVSKAISFDKMSGYAHGILDSAIDQLVAQVGDLAGDGADDAALSAFGQALEQTLAPHVDAFMAGPGAELVEALQDWADTSPRSVAMIALLAAVGAIAANAKAPALKAKLKIAQGLTAKVEARIGRFQNISLEQIKAQLEAQREFDAGTLKAKLEYVYDPEKGDSYHGELRFQAPDGRWVTGLAATHDRDGESVDAFIQRSWPKENLAIELRGRMHDELGPSVMFGVKWKF